MISQHPADAANLPAHFTMVDASRFPWRIAPDASANGLADFIAMSRRVNAERGRASGYVEPKRAYRRKAKPARKHKCRDCGKMIEPASTRCRTCARRWNGQHGQLSFKALNDAAEGG